MRKMISFYYVNNHKLAHGVVTKNMPIFFIFNIIIVLLRLTPKTVKLGVYVLCTSTSNIYVRL